MGEVSRSFLRYPVLVFFDTLRPGDIQRMKRFSLLTLFCSGLVMGTASDGHAQPEPVEGQEGDDILEVLMLPVEMQEAKASGMTEKDVEGVVEAFRESGMPPGEAAAVLRFERTLNARRGLKKGFSDHVLRQLSDGAATTEVIASLREREASDSIDSDEQKRLKKAASRRAKAERAKTESRRKRDRGKRARGEKVIIRGQMRMLPGVDGQGDLRPPEVAIDLAWLQKRLEMVQRRVIKLDRREAKLPAKAQAKGFDKQRESLMKEREALVNFIGRMKGLDADGQFEGSARDQLVDEIKTALKIDRRKVGGAAVRMGGKGEGAARAPQGSPGAAGEALFDPFDRPRPLRGPNERELGKALGKGEGKGERGTMNKGAGAPRGPGSEMTGSEMPGNGKQGLHGSKDPSAGGGPSEDSPSGESAKELRGHNSGKEKAK